MRAKFVNEAVKHLSPRSEEEMANHSGVDLKEIGLNFTTIYQDKDHEKVQIEEIGLLPGTNDIYVNFKHLRNYEDDEEYEYHTWHLDEFKHTYKPTN